MSPCQLDLVAHSLDLQPEAMSSVGAPSLHVCEYVLVGFAGFVLQQRDEGFQLVPIWSSP